MTEPFGWLLRMSGVDGLTVAGADCNTDNNVAKGREAEASAVTYLSSIMAKAIQVCRAEEEQMFGYIS